MVQARSYTSLAFFSIIAPDTFESTCGSISSYDHMLWLCPSLRGPNEVNEEEWSSPITSSELLPQVRAVQRAPDAAVRLGLPSPSGSVPWCCFKGGASQDLNKVLRLFCPFPH
ncbi:hypothetical protein HPB47_003832 [Ixodes persulcatus]|uniref:Uncharacterized protein n=1 Tax=Ixodes persulcatus TaxID=34615 RepID=A0AC60PHK9_IXOPE|nr:hypothetical protein HPB47_003832 [Ixodes persulcatus]